MIPRWLIHYPKLWAGCTWLISISTAIVVLVLADFGGPPWIFVMCGLWLCSLGLPTTVTLLALASLWGNLPLLGTPSLSAFMVSAMILSFIAQMLCFLLLRGFLNRRMDV